MNDPIATLVGLAFAAVIGLATGALLAYGLTVVGTL